MALPTQQQSSSHSIFPYKIPHIIVLFYKNLVDDTSSHATVEQRGYISSSTMPPCTLDNFEHTSRSSSVFYSRVEEQTAADLKRKFKFKQNFKII